MKKLYYKFLLLLIQKPFVHLTISILSIFILRVIFIQIVLADTYIESSSPELLLQEYMKTQENVGETRDEHNKHVKQVYERVTLDFQRKMDNMTIYQLMNDVKPEDTESSSGNHTDLKIKDNIPINSESLTETYPNHWEYNLILDHFVEVVNKIETKEDLIKQSINYVTNILPHSTWATNDVQLKDKQSLIQFHINNIHQTLKTIQDSDQLLEQAICAKLYTIAILTYNVAMATGITHNTEIIQHIFVNNMNFIFGKEFSEKLLEQYD